MKDMNSIELMMHIAKMEKEHEEVIRRLIALENALFLAQDYQALGLARCLEGELISAKKALTKSAIYNSQLQNLLNTKYGE